MFRVEEGQTGVVVLSEEAAPAEAVVLVAVVVRIAVEGVEGVESEEAPVAVVLEEAVSVAAA